MKQCPECLNWYPNHDKRCPECNKKLIDNEYEQEEETSDAEGNSDIQLQ